MTQKKESDKNQIPLSESFCVCRASASLPRAQYSCLFHGLTKQQTSCSVFCVILCVLWAIFLLVLLIEAALFPKQSSCSVFCVIQRVAASAIAPPWANSFVEPVWFWLRQVGGSSLWGSVRFLFEVTDVNEIAATVLRQQA